MDRSRPPTTSTRHTSSCSSPLPTRPRCRPRRACRSSRRRWSCPSSPARSVSPWPIGDQAIDRDTVQRHRDQGLGDHPERHASPDAERCRLCLRRLVGRRGPEPYDHRRDLGHLYGDLCLRRHLPRRRPEPAARHADGQRPDGDVQEPRRPDVPGGRSGRGAGGAVAVTGNLTVTGQSAPGYLFLGPDPLNDPSTSTLNFPLGDNRANGVTVALRAGGTPGSRRHLCGQSVDRDDPGHLRRHRLLHRRCNAAPPTTPSARRRLLDTRTGNGLTGPFRVARRPDVPGGRSGRGAERRDRGHRQPDGHRPDRAGLPLPRTGSARTTRAPRPSTSRSATTGPTG